MTTNMCLEVTGSGIPSQPHNLMVDPLRGDATALGHRHCGEGVRSTGWGPRVHFCVIQRSGRRAEGTGRRFLAFLSPQCALRSWYRRQKKETGNCPPCKLEGKVMKYHRVTKHDLQFNGRLIVPTCVSVNANHIEAVRIYVQSKRPRLIKTHHIIRIRWKASAWYPVMIKRRHCVPHSIEEYRTY